MGTRGLNTRSLCIRTVLLLGVASAVIGAGMRCFAQAKPRVEPPSVYGPVELPGPIEMSSSSKGDMPLARPSGSPVDPWDRHGRPAPVLTDYLLYYPPTVADTNVEDILSDKGARISEDFRVPAGIHDLVKFWLAIYTQYTSRHVVIFDSRDPRMVYDVVDLRELHDRSRNAVAYEIAAKRLVKRKVQAYRRALAELSRNPHPKYPTAEEAKIVALKKSTGTTESFASLCHHVRSQTGQRDNVVRGLVGADPYMAEMEMVFHEMGMPLELTRLALVESSFNFHAISRVGAAGVWQFMPTSAKEYITVSHSIDERLSPLKSTVAAAKLLKRNYSVLGDWALAVVSYNHGFRGLPHFSGDDDHDFDDIAPLFSGKGKRHLGFASKSYYAEFLALLHADAYRDTFFDQIPRAPEQNVVFNKISSPANASELASANGIDLHSFEEYNPDIRDVRARLPAGFWYASPAKDDDLSVLSTMRHRSIRRGFRVASYRRHKPRHRKHQKTSET